jgi:hypothetical protein
LLSAEKKSSTVDYGDFILLENDEEIAKGVYFEHEGLYYLNGHFLKTKDLISGTAKVFWIPLE